jgi:hypothetical protein
VTVHTAGRQGRLDKSIDVDTNDPAKPHFQLKMKGTIDVLVAFEPAWLQLGALAKKATEVRTVKVTGREAAKLTLTDITTSDPRVKAQFVKDKDGPSLKVTVATGDQDGSLGAKVTAKTGLVKPATIELTVVAQIGAPPPAPSGPAAVQRFPPGASRMVKPEILRRPPPSVKPK